MNNPSDMSEPIRIGDKTFISLSPGTAAAAAHTGYDYEAIGVSRPMSWSIGGLADFLWMKLPESRLYIAELAKKCLDSAVEIGCDLIGPLPDTVAREAFWLPFLEVSLKDYPRSLDCLDELFELLRQAFLLDTVDAEVTRQVLSDYIFEKLADRYWPIVVDVNPVLASLIRERIEVFE